jgi:hypothetical protein
VGVLPFHPTIGSEAFILSTLATPVPSHDITRELCHFLEILSLSQHPCEVYQMLPQHQAHNLPLFFCISGSCTFPSVHALLSGVSPSLCRASLMLSLSSMSLFPCLYFLYLFPDGSRPIMFLLSEGNSGQPGLQTLWYFGLTFFSQTMLPFMGVVEYSTTSPSFIN